MKKLILFLGVLTIGLLTFSGCKKKDGDGDNLDQYNKVKSAKFVLTTNDLQASDRFTVVFTGADSQGKATTIFSINGTPQTNQRTLNLTYAQLKAGVTIETTTALNTVVMTISGFADPALAHSFAFRVKPTINGETKSDITATIASSPAYTQQFSY